MNPWEQPFQRKDLDTCHAYRFEVTLLKLLKYVMFCIVRNLPDKRNAYIQHKRSFMVILQSKQNAILALHRMLRSSIACSKALKYRV